MERSFQLGQDTAGTFGWSEGSSVYPTKKTLNHFSSLNVTTRMNLDESAWYITNKDGDIQISPRITLNKMVVTRKKKKTMKIK